MEWIRLRCTANEKKEEAAREGTGCWVQMGRMSHL